MYVKIYNNTKIKVWTFIRPCYFVFYSNRFHIILSFFTQTYLMWYWYLVYQKLHMNASACVYLGLFWCILKIFMGPTWGPPGSCRPQVGPMLAPLGLLSGIPNDTLYLSHWSFFKFEPGSRWPLFVSNLGHYHPVLRVKFPCNGDSSTTQYLNKIITMKKRCETKFIS